MDRALLDAHFDEAVADARRRAIERGASARGGSDGFQARWRVEIEGVSCLAVARFFVQPVVILRGARLIAMRCECEASIRDPLAGGDAGAPYARAERVFSFKEKDGRSSDRPEAAEVFAQAWAEANSQLPGSAAFRALAEVARSRAELRAAVDEPDEGSGSSRRSGGARL